MPLATRSAASSSLRLRQWRDADLAPFTAMNADADVMRFFLKRLTHDESAALMQRFRDGIEQRGWGLWAVEVDGEFAGLAGLNEPAWETHFTPCVEIGWRFHKKFWGRGIAFAAASMAMTYARDTLRLPELVAFTTETNLCSRRLMERLGFSRNPHDDFPHPAVPENHPLRPHVLYRKRWE
ncbi:acetyltransferase, ribosomal protein N-acetylase [Opitutaceae bacterium TAV1]|nr:acetyltransferase, ribosomal protein N-acetylase [Opitutaceae bacterium TAV1]